MMYIATITPSLTPRTQTPQPPPIPNRPTPSTLKADEDALTRSRSSSGPPPLPRRGSPAPAKLSVSPNSSDPHGTMPLAARREPPRPPRDTAASDSAFKPSSSTIDAIQRRRAAPAVPSEGASSKMPPPPPPASRPTISVGLDESPPDGLVTPVQPSTKSTPAPSLPARKATLPAPSSAATQATPTPSLPERKPGAAVSAQEEKSGASGTATQRAGPLVSAPPKPTAITTGQRSTNGTKTGSVADRLKQWEQLGTQSGPKTATPQSPVKPSSSSIPPSPVQRASETRPIPPAKPKKPDTLRKPSGEAPSST